MRKLTLLFIALLTTIPMYAQDITGQWNGILKVQGLQLRIALHVSYTENEYSSTMDSPDQGAKGIPVSSTRYENSILKFEIASAGIYYEGTLNEENVFVGTFKQAGQSYHLNLAREMGEKDKVIRPQNPIKPYPYYSEDIKFSNTKDKIVLAGTLTLPKEGGIYPAVILISGSGPQNRDEEIFGHKPFLVLADALTKNGIAVLRFDDRGTAESTGNFEASTSLDFASDVEFALQYLKTRKEIDKNKIGLIGHSEGAIIAPIVASKTTDISYIVMLAGTGMAGDQLLLLQKELIGKSYGISDAKLQADKRISKGAFDIIVNADTADSLEFELARYFIQAIKDNPSFEYPGGMNEEGFVKLQVEKLSSPWMVNFLKYDPTSTLEKVQCPVLAINGEKDLQVPAKVNLEAIKKALEKGGNENVTIIELASLNHLFQKCETGSPAEYGRIEETFSPLALEEISNWIVKQVK